MDQAIYINIQYIRDGILKYLALFSAAELLSYVHVSDKHSYNIFFYIKMSFISWKFTIHTIWYSIGKCEWMNVKWGGEKKTMKNSFILEIPGHGW